MPRVVITCQVCGRRLAFLELAPGMTGSCYCPACDAEATATMSADGQVQEVTTDGGRANEAQVRTRQRHPESRG